MATYSSTLAWKIPWMEEPGRLQSMGSLGVEHDWATSLSRTGEGNGNPLQYSCLENPRDGGAWWAAVYGVVQSWTQMKRLSSSNRSTELHWKLILENGSPERHTMGNKVFQFSNFGKLLITCHLWETKVLIPHGRETSQTLLNLLSDLAWGMGGRWAVKVATMPIKSLYFIL